MKYYTIIPLYGGTKVETQIKSLKQNFPDFEQGFTRIAAFGPTTAKEVLDQGLILDIEAPMPNAPSMTGALELYIKKANNL